VILYKPERGIIVKERIKELRKFLNLNQTEFGERIGVKQGTIAGYENGMRTPSEAVILSICREFKVNHIWLTEGVGEMFLNLPETLLDELKIEYNLDDLDIEIIREFINMDAADREVLKAFIRNINSNKQKNQPE
jgi:transcriptional regulator with XRE-family HTH domain